MPKNMNHTLVYRSAWAKIDDETIEQHHRRMNKQRAELHQAVFEHGHCFMVKYADDDIRPVWEDQIDQDQLRQELLAPDGLVWDCPLCQPYDAWYGRDNVKENRRYLCRIISPDINVGCVEEDGIYSKCVCLKTGERKHKFKRRSV